MLLEKKPFGTTEAPQCIRKELVRSSEGVGLGRQGCSSADCFYEHTQKDIFAKDAVCYPAYSLAESFCSNGSIIQQSDLGIAPVVEQIRKDIRRQIEIVRAFLKISPALTKGLNTLLTQQLVGLTRLLENRFAAPRLTGLEAQKCINKALVIFFSIFNAGTN